MAPPAGGPGETVPLVGAAAAAVGSVVLLGISQSHALKPFKNTFLKKADRDLKKLAKEFFFEGAERKGWSLLQGGDNKEVTL